MTRFERFEYLEIEEHPIPVRPQSSVTLEPEVTPRATMTRRRLVVEEIIGRYGTGIGEFNCPGGLAIDRYGGFYIADSYNHRIQKIMPNGTAITIGSKGTAPGHFLNPQDIAIDDRCSLYILEQGNCRIQKISADGRLEMIIGRRGSNPGEFNSPMGLAMDNYGFLFVADTGNGRIQKLSPTGFPAFTVSSNQCRQLYRPQGVEVNQAGECFIADTFCHCIVKIDSRGREVARFGCRGRGPNQFDEPQDLALDSEGVLYVVEMSNNRLQVLDVQGRHATSFDASSSRMGRLKAPTGIVISPRGEVYIADTMNHRILKAAWR